MYQICVHDHYFQMYSEGFFGFFLNVILTMKLNF